MSNIHNIVIERFEFLPKSIQEVIMNSNWSEKIRKICAQNNILLDVANVVENATLMMLVGVINSEEFMQDLKEEGIEHERIVKILSEIDNEIFKPIKDDLIMVYNDFSSVDKDQTESEHEQDTSLDFLAGRSEDIIESRDEILKEIEDKEPIDIKIFENTTSIQKQTEVPEVKNENNPFAKKLENPITNSAQSVKIDPYREPIE